MTEPLRTENQDAPARAPGLERTPLVVPRGTESQHDRSARRGWLVLACLWTLFIFVVCWTPQNRLPVDENRTPLLKVLHADKVVHASVFAVFGALWMHSLTSERRAVWTLLAGVALAIITEAGQGLMPIGRVADLLDGLADTAGAAISVFLYSRYALRA